MGRPSDYSQKVADSICAQIAEGVSLRTICAADDMPSKQTVFSWFRKHAEFLDQYTRAKEQSTAAHFEDLVSIADEDPLEPVLDKEGMPVPDGEGGFLKAATKTSIDHARLRIETRKWALAKLMPRKFGERQVIDATINDYSSMSPEDRKRRLMELQQELRNAERG